MHFRTENDSLSWLKTFHREYPFFCTFFGFFLWNHRFLFSKLFFFMGRFLSSIAGSWSNWEGEGVCTFWSPFFPPSVTLEGRKFHSLYFFWIAYDHCHNQYYYLFVFLRLFIQIISCMKLDHHNNFIFFSLLNGIWFLLSTLLNSRFPHTLYWHDSSTY